MQSVILLALVGAAMAIPALYHDPHHGGQSSTYRKQDNHGNYEFGYDIKRGNGASDFRKEKGDGHGGKVGSYGLIDKDGRQRIVHYIADEHGFRVKIDTNEPGTANKDSAAAIVNGPDHDGHSATVIASGEHAAPALNHGPVGHHGPVLATGHILPALETPIIAGPPAAFYGPEYRSASSQVVIQHP